jgi:hypothetical protein
LDCNISSNKMKILHKFNSFFIGISSLFMYWDKYASVLEFNIFNHVVYYYIKEK